MKTPETIQDLIDWGEKIQKKDSDKLFQYIKDCIEEYNFEFGEDPDEEDMNSFFYSYNYDLTAVRLTKIKNALKKLQNMVGMEDIKRSVVDLVLYYIQDFHQKNNEYLHTVITGPPGCGKCLHPDTPVRLFSGEIIPAKEIKVGYLLMGDRSEAQKVVATTENMNCRDIMYKIKQSNGKSYIVNSEHILTLILVKDGEIIEHNNRDIIPVKFYSVEYADRYGYTVRNFDSYQEAVEYFHYYAPKRGDRIDIPLKEYINMPVIWKEYYKGFRIPVYNFKGSTIKQRRELLDITMNGFDEIVVGKKDKKRLMEIITSLGLSADVERYREIDINISTTENKKDKIYLIKNIGQRFSDITVKKLKEGDYFGFELNSVDGSECSGRFLLGDFTVTHNTTVAEILGEIYAGVGILKTNKFVHLSRSDLIAKYLGQSAIKTKEALTECIGGVAFIDEAYSLAPKDVDRDSFAKEVIDTLNQFLSEHKDDFVCIIAGYKEDLESTFFAMNKGLERRFPWRFNIESYTSKDLAEITRRKIKEMDWQIGVSDDKMEKIFKDNNRYFKHFGGDIETFLTKCKFCHVKRVFSKDISEKKIFTFEDMENGMKKHIEHYSTKEDKRPPFGMYT